MASVTAMTREIAVRLGSGIVEWLCPACGGAYRCESGLLVAHDTGLSAARECPGSSHPPRSYWRWRAAAAAGHGD